MGLTVYRSAGTLIILSLLSIPTSAAAQLNTALFAVSPALDAILTEDLAFVSNTTWSQLDCAALCLSDLSCVIATYTPSQRMCRGHSDLTASSGNAIATPGTAGFQLVSDVSASAASAVPASLNETNCRQLQSAPYGAHSGVYNLRVTGTGQRTPVYCDQTTEGGGWTVFQRRVDGAVDFNRQLQDYQNGFGDLAGEFWLGLDTLSQMMEPFLSYELRVDMRNGDGDEGYAVYDDFRVDDVSNWYMLTVHNYNALRSNMGDAMSGLDNQRFSAPDMDLDSFGSNCALDTQSAFWYKDCTRVFVNGPYGAERGIYWNGWGSHGTFVAMQFRVI